MNSNFVKSALVPYKGKLMGGGVSLLQFHQKYVVWSKSFRPDVQKPRQMENAVRDISAIYGEVNVLVEKCVEIKGDYVEK